MQKSPLSQNLRINIKNTKDTQQNSPAGGGTNSNDEVEYCLEYGRKFTFILSPNMERNKKFPTPITNELENGQEEELKI